MDDDILKGLQEHLDKVFPNPEQDDQFRMGSLREWLAGKSADYKLTTVDIKNYELT